MLEAEADQRRVQLGREAALKQHGRVHQLIDEPFDEPRKPVHQLIDELDNESRKPVPQLIEELDNEPRKKSSGEATEQAAQMVGTNRQYVSDAKKLRGNLPKSAYRAKYRRRSERHPSPDVLIGAKSAKSHPCRPSAKTTQ